MKMLFRHSLTLLAMMAALTTFAEDNAESSDVPRHDEVPRRVLERRVVSRSISHEGQRTEVTDSSGQTVSATSTPAGSPNNQRAIPRRLLGQESDETKATEPPPKRFDFIFAGGSAQEYIAAIEEALGAPVNAIIPPEASFFTLPPVELYNVQVSDIMRVMRWSGKYMDVRPYGGGYSTSNEDVGYAWNRENDIWVMSVKPPPAQNPSYYTVEPIFVGDLLQAYSIEEITTAIDTSWDLQSTNNEESQLLFHPQTAILLVKGTEGDQILTQKVLGTLRKGQPLIEEMKRRDLSIKVTVLDGEGVPGEYELDQRRANLLSLAILAKVPLSKKDLGNDAYIRRKSDPHTEFKVDVNEIMYEDKPIPELFDGDQIKFRKTSNVFQ